MTLELTIDPNGYVLSDVHQNPRAQLATHRAFVADLLLRELAHHGGFVSVQLMGKES